LSHVLEGMDVLDVRFGEVYCLRCVYFSSIASHWTKCISPLLPGQGSCFGFIIDYAHRASPFSVQTRFPSTPQWRISLSLCATSVVDPGLTLLSFCHALAEMLVLSSAARLRVHVRPALAPLQTRSLVYPLLHYISTSG